MNLKESYRYANYLDSLIKTAEEYLSSRSFVTTTTQHHFRSEVNHDAKDETTVAKTLYDDVEFTPNDVIDFAVKVLDEKEALANAIVAAKATVKINIDTAISMNKTRQEFARVLSGMSSIKPSESQTQGYDYTFNVDKNQTKYCYPIKEVVTIDFDRNDVKALVKKYNKICDEVSAKLDSIVINTVVCFEPKFDLNESFEDVVIGMMSTK